MSESSSPFLRTLRWLATHARLPASRLEPRAELLVLIAAAAEAEGNGPDGPANRKVERNANFSAQMRSYTAQRRRAHITCDNSAKT